MLVCLPCKARVTGQRGEPLGISLGIRRIEDITLQLEAEYTVSSVSHMQGSGGMIGTVPSQVC